MFPLGNPHSLLPSATSHGVLPQQTLWSPCTAPCAPAMLCLFLCHNASQSTMHACTALEPGFRQKLLPIDTRCSEPLWPRPAEGLDESSLLSSATMLLEPNPVSECTAVTASASGSHPRLSNQSPRHLAQFCWSLVWASHPLPSPFQHHYVSRNGRVASTPLLPS